MSGPTENHLNPTPMLDFLSEDIQQLVHRRGWAGVSPAEAAKAIYLFVRDEVAFGYNRDDTLSASEVLRDGYGQCNTKGTLLMALLRAVGIPTRCHGFTIYNELQKGAIPNYLFRLAPERILHSWVEVWLDGRWLEIEGYIIDTAYLAQVQKRFADECESFSAYGIATTCLKTPENEWTGSNTYIQKEGIADDFGVFAQPDDFYRERGRNLTGLRRLLFRALFRHLMNWNVRRIRARGLV